MHWCRPCSHGCCSKLCQLVVVSPAWLVQLITQHEFHAGQPCWIWTQILVCALLTVLSNNCIHLAVYVRQALASLWHSRSLCWCSAGCSSIAIRHQHWFEALLDALLLCSPQDCLSRYAGAAVEAGTARRLTRFSSCHCYLSMLVHAAERFLLILSRPT